MVIEALVIGLALDQVLSGFSLGVNLFSTPQSLVLVLILSGLGVDFVTFKVVSTTTLHTQICTRARDAEGEAGEIPIQQLLPGMCATPLLPLQQQLHLL